MEQGMSEVNIIECRLSVKKLTKQTQVYLCLKGEVHGQSRQLGTL